MTSPVTGAARQSPRAAKEALGIAEVLENILHNLTLADILCNAQTVSPFWRNCITGSRILRRKCLLLPSTTDDYTADNILYMNFSCPIAAYQDIHPRQIAVFQYFIESPRPVLPQIRGFLDRAVHTHFDGYLTFVATMYRTSPNEHHHFDINSGIRYKFWAAMTQVRADVAHPFIRRYTWAPQQCFWTGYRNRLVLLVFDVDKPITGDFIALQKILTTLNQMIGDCPTISCLDAPLTRPAATTLTLSLQRPTSNAYNEGLARTYCKERDTGVTIRDMLLLLARVAISLFEGYTDPHRPLTMDTTRLMIACARSLQALLK
ncbi:hypothetical protein HBH47_024400 [Parastagonospora nodorum]|nr:hypothetical protein HBH47_024400 [Parastagonospora nodorum]